MFHNYWSRYWIRVWVFLSRKENPIPNCSKKEPAARETAHKGTVRHVFRDVNNNGNPAQGSKEAPPSLQTVQKKLSFKSPSKAKSETDLTRLDGSLTLPPEINRDERARDSDFCTPQAQNEKSDPPQLKEKEFCNDQNEVTAEKPGHPPTLAGQEIPAKSKIQRELFPLAKAEPKMRSGLKFNRMTNVGFDSPPSSPDAGCSLLNESTALASINQNYDWTDEDTSFTDINDSNVLESGDKSVLEECLFEQEGDLLQTPQKNIFQSFCSDIFDKRESSPLADTGDEVTLNVSTQKDTSSCSTDIQIDSTVKTTGNDVKSKSPLSVSINVPDTNPAPTVSSLMVDIQSAGIDVAEELIVLPLSPLNFNQDVLGGEEQPTIPQDLNEPDKTLQPHLPGDELEDDNNPDDPEYFPDATAPGNLSGLESDAGSGGESPKPRRRNPNNWKQNQRKLKNNTGQEHINSRGNKQAARDVITEGCSPTCKKECHSRITLEQRIEINKRYWSIGDTSRQWDFLSRHVRGGPVKRRTVHSGDPYRNNTNSYFFTVGSTQIEVCQKMFLNTLNISAMRVRVAHKKMISKDGVISPDKRGKTNKKRRVHPSTVASVVAHVNSYPTYESHYTRRSSKKKYLDARLNVSKMYRNYAASRPTGMAHTATARQYQDIFRNQFKHKLGFYKPKKDQCGTCLRWNSRSAEEKLDETLKAKYEKHVDNKVKAREIKNDHIKEGENDSKICVASFDLQKVFFCPYGENGEFIFKRKLRCYNLSIYQSVKKIGYCYVWDETTAKKGAVEISSCVWSFIEQKVKEGFTKFFFVSDNCWNQNKNSILFAMYNMATIKFNIEIEHTYMEKGHTQMECDSIHSLIERRCKNLTLCTPQSWYGVIRTAKVPDNKKNSPFHPYVVKVMTKENIFNFKAVMSEQNLDKIPKSKVRQISIAQNVAKFKREFDGPEEEVSLVKKRTGRPMNFTTFKLKQMYTSILPLKSAQLKDLLWLCDQKHIPEPDCQYFYRLAQEMQELPTNDNDNPTEDEEIESSNETDDESESDDSDS